MGRQVQGKYLDNIQTAFAVPASGAIFGAFFIPTVGSAENQRIGDQIYQKKLEAQIVLSLPQAVPDVFNVVRLVLIKWHVDSASDVPTMAKIFQDTTTLPYLSRFNDSSIEANRFSVLFDKCYTMSSAGSNYVRTMKWLFYGKRLGKKKTVFNPGTTTGYDNVLLIAISDSAVASHPNIAFTVRAHYTDA